MSEYNRNTTHWGSQDGKSRLIKDIDDDHFVNILNWVNTRKKFYPPALYAFLETEAELRILTNFTSNTPYPRKLETGEYVLVNMTRKQALYHFIKRRYYRYKLGIMSKLNTIIGVSVK